MITYTYNTDTGDFTKWLKAHQDCERLVMRGSALYCGETDTIDSMNMAILEAKIKVFDVSDFRILSVEDDNKDLLELEKCNAGYWAGCSLDLYPFGILERMVLNRDYATCFVWVGNLLLSEDLRTLIYFRLTSEQKRNKIVIPSTVENIGRYAFMGIEDLPSFEIQGVLKAIDTAAFYDCWELNFSLPDTLERLGDWAFGGCFLYDVTIPPKIDTIPQGCFQNCSSINMDSLAHVKHIKDMAFESCYISEIRLPEGIETIGRWAFTGVDFIHLPASLVDIDRGFYLDEEWDSGSIPYVEVAVDNPVFFDKNGTLFKKGESEPYLGCDFVPKQEKSLLIPTSEFVWEYKYTLDELKKLYYSVSPVNSEQTLFKVWNGKEHYDNIIDCYCNEYLAKDMVKDIDVSFNHFIIVNHKFVYSIDMKELLMDASQLEYEITDCDNEGRIYVMTGVVIDDFYAPLFPNEPLPLYWCVDIKGNPLLKNKYNGLDYFDANGLAPAAMGKLWGMIDTDENVVIPFAYKSIGHFDSEEMAMVSKGRKIGYINKNGELVIPFRYNFIYRPFNKEGYAYAEIYKGRETKGYFINRRGEELGEFQPRDKYEGVYSPGFHLFVNNGKYGYCKQFAREFSGCIYQDIRKINEKCIEVSLDGVTYKQVLLKV